MDFHLLLPGEAAALVGISVSRILELIELGQLGAFRNRDQVWIPLQSLALYGGDDFKVEAAGALALLVKHAGELTQTFAEHPEAAERIEASDFESGSVGACLKQALVMSRRSRSAQSAGER